MGEGFQMTMVVKEFYELSLDELWEIYALRSQVFVVEQKCAYQDIDLFDKKSYHFMYLDREGKLQAYCRFIPAGVKEKEASIGRMVVQMRRKGLGSKLIQEAIKFASEELSTYRVVVEAQTYAENFYKKNGFKRVGDEFSMDGIPHVKMLWTENGG